MLHDFGLLVVKRRGMMPQTFIDKIAWMQAELAQERVRTLFLHGHAISIVRDCLDKTCVGKCSLGAISSRSGSAVPESNNLRRITRGCSGASQADRRRVVPNQDSVQFEGWRR